MSNMKGSGAFGEKVEATLVGPGGEIKQKVGYPLPTPEKKELHFCPNCGGPTKQVMLRICVPCDKRYMVTEQAVDGKLMPVIIEVEGA